MGTNCLSHFHKSIITMKSLICLLSVVVAASATFLAPPPPPHYRRPGYPGHSPLGGGSIDPMTYLLLNKNGGLGGSGSSSLLPLLGGGGLGGMGGGYGGHGGHGKFNPLLLTLLGGCTEKHTGGCTQPTVANGDANQKCGMNDQGQSCQSAAGPNPTSVNCKPCCTCPDTPSATL